MMWMITRVELGVGWRERDDGGDVNDVDDVGEMVDMDETDVSTFFFILAKQPGDHQCAQPRSKEKPKSYPVSCPHPAPAGFLL